MLQNVYNIQVRCLAHKSEGHSVLVQRLEVYMWWQQCTRMSLGTQWIFPDTEPADTGGHSGIYLEWVKETSMYRILCECVMAYNGQTGCSIKTGTNDSSVLNKSAAAEHGINILLKGKVVLARKYVQLHKLHHVGHDSDGVLLRWDGYCLSKSWTRLIWNAGVCIGCVHSVHRVCVGCA